jgi:hypothetical protein
MLSAWRDQVREGTPDVRPWEVTAEEPAEMWWCSRMIRIQADVPAKHGRLYRPGYRELLLELVACVIDLTETLGDLALALIGSTLRLLARIPWKAPKPWQ